MITMTAEPTTLMGREEREGPAYPLWIERLLLLCGVAQHEGWPAAEAWGTEGGLLTTLGARLQLPIAELFPLHGHGKPQKLRLPLNAYREYAATNTVDFPYYPWERDFDAPVSSDL